MKSKQFENLQKDVIVTFKVRKNDGSIKHWALFKSYFNKILNSTNLFKDQLIKHYEFLKKILEERDIIPDEEQLRGFLWKFACNDGRTNEWELQNLETVDKPLDQVWACIVFIGKKQVKKTFQLAWVVKTSVVLGVSFDDIENSMGHVCSKLENQKFYDEEEFAQNLFQTLIKRIKENN